MLYIIQSILYRTRPVTASNLIDEMQVIIGILPAWDNKPNKWFIAHPSKEIVIFSSTGISSEALMYLNESLLKKKPVSIVLAGEEKDESSVVIWYKNTPTLSEERYSLTIAIRSPYPFNDRNTFQKIITDMSMLTHWTYSYISLETEQYRMEQQAVFEDRLSSGWMLYLPKEIRKDEVPSATAVINFPDKKSTLIIIKNEFNGKDSNDIICANNVEIELAANGYLPKWFEL